MTTTVIETRAILSAQDRTAAAFASAARNAAGLERQMSSLGRMLAALGGVAPRIRALAASLAAPVTGLFSIGAITSAARAYSEANRELLRIGINADASSAEIETMRRGLWSTAQETSQGFGEVRGGLQALIASGMNARQAMEFLPVVARTAQAAGASTTDIANSTQALAEAFRIASPQMQEAMDVLVHGGKMGKFELRDMARYIPSLAPAMAAIGGTGVQGLRQLTAMLQTIRMGTGTAEEAAASATNIFQKMTSDETATRFRRFNIDIRAELEKTRREGGSVVETFMRLADQAVRGDLARVNELIPDQEFARGVRAMLQYGEHYRRFLGELQSGAPGAVMRDLARVTGDSASAAQRAATAQARLVEEIGRMADPAITRGTDLYARAIETLTERLVEAEARMRGMFESQSTEAERRRQRVESGEAVDDDMARILELRRAESELRAFLADRRRVMANPSRAAAARERLTEIEKDLAEARRSLEGSSEARRRNQPSREGDQGAATPEALDPRDRPRGRWDGTGFDPRFGGLGFGRRGPFPVPLPRPDDIPPTPGQPPHGPLAPPRLPGRPGFEGPGYDVPRFRDGAPFPWMRPEAPSIVVPPGAVVARPPSESELRRGFGEDRGSLLPRAPAVGSDNVRSPRRPPLAAPIAPGSIEDAARAGAEQIENIFGGIDLTEAGRRAMRSIGEGMREENARTLAEVDAFIAEVTRKVEGARPRLRIDLQTPPVPNTGRSMPQAGGDPYATP